LQLPYRETSFFPTKASPRCPPTNVFFLRARPYSCPVFSLPPFKTFSPPQPLPIVTIPPQAPEEKFDGQVSPSFVVWIPVSQNCFSGSPIPPLWILPPSLLARLFYSPNRRIGRAWFSRFLLFISTRASFLSSGEAQLVRTG